jgi:voltage-gated potassium channel
MKLSENAECPSSSRKPHWKRLLHEVIFEADTPAGKAFDVLLIISILVSVVVVMLDSIGPVRLEHGTLFYGVEWFFTLLFTVEYLLRLLCVGRPLKYAASFYGLVDLLAIIPTYWSLVLPGSQYLLVIRILRILRIFRILKLVPYLGEAQLLVRALRPQNRRFSVYCADAGGHFRIAHVCHRK